MFSFFNSANSLFTVIFFAFLIFIGALPFISAIRTIKQITETLEKLGNGDYRAFELLIDGKTTRETGGEHSSTYYYVKSEDVVLQVNSSEYGVAIIGEPAVVVVTEQKKGLNCQFYGVSLLK